MNYAVIVWYNVLCLLLQTLLLMIALCSWICQFHGQLEICHHVW